MVQWYGELLADQASLTFCNTFQSQIMNTVSFFPKLIACCLALLVLIVLHVIPLPILEIVILYVMIFRPRWFKDLVDQLYDR
jgi:hypothetical protein